MMLTIKHEAVTLFAALKPTRNACDGCRAEAGLFLNRRIGDALVEHPGDPPTLRKFFNFLLRQKIAKKPLGLIQGF